jgi:hypothetical protein
MVAIAASARSAATLAVEYWSLEQPKLGSAKEPPLAGQVA